jgi:hypothetical protein
MDEMKGKIRGQDRSRNIQSSEGGSSRRDEISRDPLPMDTLQSGRHRSGSSRDALQSARFSTSHDPRENNRRTQISRDVLLSVRFSTGHDSRDNNRITESCHNQERQAVNASTSGARGNNFGGRILNFFARRKKI